MCDNAEKIKQSINMLDISSRYGLGLNGRKAICCPFHREKTASFKLYAEKKKYHCFGCGADGDVISFAMRYFDISFGQAIARLASDFGISVVGIDKPPLRERMKMQQIRRDVKEKRAESEKEYNALYERYMNAEDECLRLRDNAQRYAPKSPQEPFCDLYAEAMHKLAYSEYLCDALQTELYNYKRRAAQCRQ